MILLVDKKTNTVRRWFEIKGRPMGVAYLRGHVYVGNESRQRVEIYNFAGKSFKKNGVFKTTIKKPTDIAVDEKSGKVFVLDGHKKIISIFNGKGNILGTIPSSGPDSQLLANPTALVVDSDRKEVIVSDYGDVAQNIAARIQIFDFNGQFQDSIKDIGEVNLIGSGSASASASTAAASVASAAISISKPAMGMGGGWGEKPRFSRPQGLAVDNNGHIFLIDCYSAEIMVFNREDGVQIKTIGGYGTEPGKMRLPLDIVREDTSGDLFVTNNRLARIEIFRQGGIIQ